MTKTEPDRNLGPGFGQTQKPVSLSRLLVKKTSK